MSTAANCIVVILEITGLYISISARHLGVFAYYTQLSNMVTLVSSLLFLLAGDGPFVSTVRYLSTCMLTMTFLITLFVLVPMGAGFRKMMLSGNGLYHHTLCPLISVTSYILWEQHGTVLAVPVVLTFIYGVIMLVLNGMRKYDGPYPFFRVHDQSKAATVLWIAVLTGTITAVSLLIAYTAP